ncbi:hypothetical protein CMV_000211 [Castanea mollissima]|uniref:60S ribosomal protein L13 n=1 Tax=Castanea mollissima TaxID=60419 RepID=A0A8J4VYW1_9ROSI|nr:hypothetical protein CMV_000211 [Castanea mollissima]
MVDHGSGIALLLKFYDGHVEKAANLRAREREREISFFIAQVRNGEAQQSRKERRRIARQKKAVKIFPRPTTGKLRPIVHGQTLKYNMKVRSGRGFSLEELKAAGIPKKYAQSIGIAVDHRRRNRSLEGLQANVQRLKTFKAKLVVFPRRVGKFKAGDSAPEELASATQVQGPYLPIVREKPSVELVKVTEEMKSFKAYDKLRLERMNVRHVGARQKKAAEAEKDEKK